MNKRFCLTLAAMFLGVAAAAQPFELGVSTGTSVNGSSQVDTGIDISYIFTIMPDLELGLGTVVVGIGVLEVEVCQLVAAFEGMRSDAGGEGVVSGGCHQIVEYHSIGAGHAA